jgi:hypothetical protein
MPHQQSSVTLADASAAGGAVSAREDEVASSAVNHTISPITLRFSDPALEQEFRVKTEPRKRVIFRIGIWAFSIVTFVNLVYLDLIEHKGKSSLPLLLGIRAFEQLGLAILLYLRVRTKWGIDNNRLVSLLTLLVLMVTIQIYFRLLKIDIFHIHINRSATLRSALWSLPPKRALTTFT